MPRTLRLMVYYMSRLCCHTHSSTPVRVRHGHGDGLVNSPYRAGFVAACSACVARSTLRNLQCRNLRCPRRAPSGKRVMQRAQVAKAALRGCAWFSSQVLCNRRCRTVLSCIFISGTVRVVVVVTDLLDCSTRLPAVAATARGGYCRRHPVSLLQQQSKARMLPRLQVHI